MMGNKQKAPQGPKQFIIWAICVFVMLGLMGFASFMFMQGVNEDKRLVEGYSQLSLNTHRLADIVDRISVGAEVDGSEFKLAVSEVETGIKKIVGGEGLFQEPLPAKARANINNFKNVWAISKEIFPDINTYLNAKESISTNTQELKGGLSDLNKSMDLLIDEMISVGVSPALILKVQAGISSMNSSVGSHTEFNAARNEVNAAINQLVRSANNSEFKINSTIPKLISHNRAELEKLANKVEEGSAGYKAREDAQVAAQKFLDLKAEQKEALESLKLTIDALPGTRIVQPTMLLIIIIGTVVGILILAIMAIVVGKTSTSVAKRESAKAITERTEQKKILDELLYWVEQLSKGDFTGELEIADPNLKPLVDALTRMITQLSARMVDVKNLSTNMISASEQSSRAVSTAHTSQKEITSALNGARLNINNLVESADTINRHSKETVEASDIARKLIMDGQKKVNQSHISINQSTDRVNDIFQTMKTVGDIIQKVYPFLRGYDDLVSRIQVVAINAQLLTSDLDEESAGKIQNYVDVLSGISDEVAAKTSNVSSLSNEMGALIQDTQRNINSARMDMNRTTELSEEVKALFEQLNDRFLFFTRKVDEVLTLNDSFKSTTGDITNHLSEVENMNLKLSRSFVDSAEAVEHVSKTAMALTKNLEKYSFSN